MSTFRRLLCCCAGGGDVTDLKKIARPHVNAVSSAAKRQDEKGEWQDAKGKKTDDEAKDNQPDVVISHNVDGEIETTESSDVEKSSRDKEHTVVEPENVDVKLEATPDAEDSGSSTSVATVGLTLVVNKPLPVSGDAATQENEAGATPSKRKGGKSGRSVFQIKRNSGSSLGSPSPLSPAAGVDKVLLVKSKKKRRDSGSSSSSSSSSDSSHH
ncbi:uncharacterized protein [Watersipora subatra]|uniref:uncharacterized protein n=1 Tax=Watersipora subatra TaxID=2589382 RepID=UPI00355BE285